MSDAADQRVPEMVGKAKVGARAMTKTSHTRDTGDWERAALQLSEGCNRPAENMGECAPRVMQIVKPFHRNLRLDVCLVRRSHDLVDPHGHFHMLHGCNIRVHATLQFYTHYDASKPPSCSLP